MRKRQWGVLAEVFRNHDVLISPTMTRPAVGVEEDDATYHVASDDGRKHGLDMTSVFNWVPWCPAMSVPAGLSLSGLPIGVHLTAPAFREDLALRVASAIEAEYPFNSPGLIHLARVTKRNARHVLTANPRSHTILQNRFCSNYSSMSMHSLPTSVSP